MTNLYVIGLHCQFVYQNLSNFSISVLLEHLFTSLCNIYLVKSVRSSLKVEPGQAKWSELVWLGSTTNFKFQPGWARAQWDIGAGLGMKWDVQARLGSGLNINQVLSWVEALA